MADNDIKIQIDVESKGARQEIAGVSKELDGLAKTAGKTTGNFGDLAGGLTSLAGRAALVVAGAGLAVKAIQELSESVVNLALEGEKIGVINNQFKLLSQQAGIAGADISEALVSAADGLADTEDILQAASGAVVALGENANRLPEVFSLARQAAAVFGGDLIQRFEQINQAIASGQTRQLKSIGLIVDADAAYKDYAKSIGLTVDQLTLAQKQSALLDATLQKGQQAFQGVDLEASALSNALQRLKVAIGEASDTVAISFKNTFGDLIKSTLESATSAINNFNTKLKEGTGQSVTIAERIAVLNAELERNEDKLAQASKGFTGLQAAYGAGAKDIERVSDSIRAQIRELERLKEKQDEASLQSSLRKQATVGGVAPSSGLTPEQQKAIQDKQLQDEIRFNQQLLSAKNQYLSARKQSVDQFASAEQIALEEQKLREIEIENEKLQNKINIDLLEKQLEIDKTLTQQEFNALREIEQQRHLSTLEKIQAESGERQKRSAKVIQDALNSIVVGGIVNAVQKSVLAIKNGENALKAFAQSVVAIFGDLAIQLGTFYIADGIAKLALFGANPAAEITAGAALVALGTIIKAAFGGATGGAGATSGSVSTSAPGGSASDVGTAPEIQEKTTKVQIDVQGTVLDPVSVGRQISQILNDTFEATGTRVVTA